MSISFPMAVFSTIKQSISSSKLGIKTKKIVCDSLSELVRQHSSEELLHSVWILMSTRRLGEVLQGLLRQTHQILKGMSDQPCLKFVKKTIFKNHHLCLRDASNHIKNRHLIHDGVEILLPGAVLIFNHLFSFFFQVCQQLIYLVE